MTWNNQSVTQLVVEEQTTGVSGFFGYSPTAAASNLVFSQSASGGTDNYGNQYPTGQAATNLPAVWYSKGASTPQVVQTATMNSSGNTITGTFANPVTSGNTVIAAVGVWGNSHNTVFTSVKFNSVTMTAAVDSVDTSIGFVVNGIFYLANVTTGGTAFTATYPNVSAEGPFSGMVEVSGLGTAPMLTISSQQGSGTSVASGSVAPPGATTAFFMAMLAYDNNGSATLTSGFTTTGANGAAYVAGSGSQEFTVALAQSAVVWLASLVAFSNAGAVQTTTLPTSISPQNTIDSVTGTGVPLGVTSNLFNIPACGTSTTQIPGPANIGCCNLYYVSNAGGNGGTLYANGLSGANVIVATT